jgi:uncharacterized protein involved in exopolysaccharide biosynthesis
MAGQNGKSNTQIRLKGRVNLITSVRDIIAIGFRHSRLIIWSFLGTTIAAAFVFLWMNPYQTELDILLHHKRVDPVLTTQAATLGGFSQDAVAPEEQNSEVQMLLSEDLLLKVAEQSGLYQKMFMWPWSDPALRIPKAARRLSNALVITPLTKSNVIKITYKSTDPQLALRVLDTLSKLYVQKHLQVHRPNGADQLFEQQADEYSQKLSNAKAKLIAYGQQHNVAAPITDRDAAVQKINDFEYSLGQTTAAISSTNERIRELDAQLATTPPRLSTSVHTSDNGMLIAQLKGTLSDLELKRTDLLSTFKPDYLPVQQIEQKIAQTRGVIADVQQAPLHENTTDVNPTYQILANDLAKAKSDLAGLGAQATTTRAVIRRYRERTLALDTQAVEQSDLLREVKTAEQSYLLYLTKADEERIQNVLDEKGILNVSIQSAPLLPRLKFYSPMLLVILATLLGMFVSLSSGLIAEYIDSSLRTPDEVKMFLEIPVLGAVPVNR